MTTYTAKFSNGETITRKSKKEIISAWATFNEDGTVYKSGFSTKKISKIPSYSEKYWVMDAKRAGEHFSFKNNNDYKEWFELRNRQQSNCPKSEIVSL